MAHVAFRPEHNLVSAFVTPIIRVAVLEASSINPGLKAAILERETEGPARKRSNYGGWQSNSDLLAWSIPEVKVLTEAIGETVRQMQAAVCDVKGREFNVMFEAWANVSRAGAYHTRHSHATSHWSGVYYVEAGAPNPEWPKSGILEFFDPRERVECVDLPGAPFGKSMGLPPETGTLTVFPGWLYHAVNPYHGPGERISISFNANLRPVKGQ
ncbi:MAG: 2OG-Fe(II) oxygenase family protein [Kiloniellales bacterium]|nr:2OG-Fe(II) oxygenase family protein [Kiloniellales bacterium]